MLRHIFWLVCLSILATFLLQQYHEIISFLLSSYHSLINMFTGIFNKTKSSVLIIGTFSLILLPLMSGAIIGGIYWLIYKKLMPHLMSVVWVSWIILLTALAH